MMSSKLPPKSKPAPPGMPCSKAACPKRSYRPRRSGLFGLARLRRLRVDRLGELVRGALERIGGATDARRVLRLERLLGIGERALDAPLGGGVERRAVLAERLLGLVDETVELVA